MRACDARVNKAAAGKYAKASVEAGRGFWELRLEAEGEQKVGDQLTVELFEVGQKVDVSGQSKGKGFQGTVKVHHFSIGPKSHGGMCKREPGSIGQSSYPSRVFKGMRMATHMGSKQATQRNIQVVKVDVERNLLLVKGCVPGPNGGFVKICKAKYQR